MRKQEGITLIALVITIIILLILAGVSIAMLSGENGLLTRASDAKEKSARAEVIERINMELSAAYANILAGEEVDETMKTTINTNLSGYATAELTDGTLTITPDDEDLGVSPGSLTKAGVLTPAAESNS